MRGVGWDLGVNWSTYQRPTFVTPAFPGFVSGHSTFSRAAAEVMTRITGSPYFPGGLPGRLAPGVTDLEPGPSEPSRSSGRPTTTRPTRPAVALWGGIHITADDVRAAAGGGVDVGKRALALDQTGLPTGSAAPAEVEG